jgi:chromosome segregation ATPase
VLVVAAVSGQAQGSGATMGDLLAEVRVLRADLTRMVGVSGRMQLLVARLSLQEQRIGTLARQLGDVQRDLARSIQDRQDTQAGLAQAQEAVRRGTVPTDIDDQIRELRKLLGQREERERQLRSMEDEVSRILASEQGRWTDFNGRIDELERALPSISLR